MSHRSSLSRFEEDCALSAENCWPVGTTVELEVGRVPPMMVGDNSWGVALIPLLVLTNIWSLAGDGSGVSGLCPAEGCEKVIIVAASSCSAMFVPKSKDTLFIKGNM